jgi:hypothetical protein
LSYFDDNKEFIRSENAIHVVISGYESVSDELQKSIFKKDLIDPMLIPHTDLEDNEMIDIEHTVDAHYGILEQSEEDGKFSWSCIVPSKVYDIRPITLDLVAPTKRELSYEWPAAEELEVKFLEKIDSEKVKINKKKLDHALNVIKIYHRHQTRKSGEPYYMHPINVAMIAIDLIRDNNSNIYEVLQAKEESIILTSLLHDILEDTYYKQKNIINDFGPEILNYIESVTKASYGNRQYLIENQVAFKDLLDREPITVIVKLADRMHNLHTIKGHKKIEKRRLIAQETLDFFVPAAERYSLMKFAQELKQISDDILDKNKN